MASSPMTDIVEDICTQGPCIFLQLVQNDQKVKLATFLFLCRESPGYLSGVFTKLLWENRRYGSFRPKGGQKYRVVFVTGTPQFQYQKENLTSSQSQLRIYRNSSSDWLVGGFLFGTEIGGYQ